MDERDLWRLASLERQTVGGADVDRGDRAVGTAQFDWFRAEAVIVGKEAEPGEAARDRRWRCGTGKPVLNPQGFPLDRIEFARAGT